MQDIVKMLEEKREHARMGGGQGRIDAQQQLIGSAHFDQPSLALSVRLAQGAFEQLVDLADIRLLFHEFRAGLRVQARSIVS